MKPTNADTTIHDLNRCRCGCSDIRELYNGYICWKHWGQPYSDWTNSYVISALTTIQNVPSVIMPSVPSAPINSLVVSNPADDFLDLRRVLITSPEGRTTV